MCQCIGISYFLPKHLNSKKKMQLLYVVAPSIILGCYAVVRSVCVFGILSWVRRLYLDCPTGFYQIGSGGSLHFLHFYLLIRRY